MTEYKGLDYMRALLARKSPRVQMRYRYYEMKNGMRDLAVTMPEKFRYLSETLGWCAKAVDSLADRLAFREFADDMLDINTIYRMNNADVLYDAAFLSALISSCSFLYISPDESGYPRIQAIDGERATGEIDPITGMLKEGYAVLSRVEDTREVLLEAHFLPGRTDYYPRGGQPYSIPNRAPYPLLVPIIHRPDMQRPFGRSRISRACMGIMQGALRTLKRSEVSAEFYAFPQKYVLGMSQDAEELDKWKATISSFLNFTKDEDGDHPTVGQFTQASMTPYVDQMRMFAALFAGETGLTTDDLGFVADNPSSAEAIKSSHENLRLAARKAQRTFGSGLLNAGYLAACVRDNTAYDRRVVYQARPLWEPIFEPDMSTLSLIGDGAIKINQAVPGYFTAGNLRELTGIEAGSET